MSAALSAVSGRLPGMSAAGCSAVLCALARLGHAPDAAWTERFLEHMEGALLIIHLWLLMHFNVCWWESECAQRCVVGTLLAHMEGAVLLVVLWLNTSSGDCW